MDASDTNDILIYKAEDGSPVTEVRLADDTVWLRQEQMAQLFGRERSVITRHVGNVFREGELEEESNVQNVHIAGSNKPVKFYNLNVIISVGYRVKSPQGTRFRQWATLNRQRFEANARELEAALQVVNKAAQSPELLADTGRGLVDIVTRDAQTFLLLQRYDEGLLAEPREERGAVLPTSTEARTALARLKADFIARGEATDLFASATTPSPPCWATSIRPFRRAGLPERGGQGRAPALLRHQEPPVFGRQQAQRRRPVRGLAQSQRPPAG